MDDWTLLTAYTRDADEQAFATLVERHIGLVYGAAYRQLRDSGKAEEVMQNVFANLAVKAITLKPTGSLAAWLYRCACRQSIDRLRQERSRTRREQQHATAMNQELTGKQVEAHWREIAPLLDEAMQSLKDEERTAILMRIFEERPLAEVGKALGVTDDTARKRVASALEQLRKWLKHRGIHCTSAALSVVLVTFAVAPTAEGLIQSTVQSALAHAATTAATTSTSTILTTMASMKLPLIAGLLAGTAMPISLGYFQERTQSPVATELPSPASEELTPSDPPVSGLVAEWFKLRNEYGPDGGSMAQLYEVIEGLDDDFRRRAFRTALVAEWAMVDPESALAYFKDAKDKRRLSDVLTVWLENDPSQAIAAMKAEGEHLKGVVGTLLEDIARRHPNALGELAALDSDSHVAPAFAIAARNDLSGTREAALSMKGRARIEALAGVAEAWAEDDVSAALDWVQGLESSEDRSRALRHVLLSWAASDPAGALDNVDLAPPGGVGTQFHFESKTPEEVLKVAARADLASTLDWLGKNHDVFPTDSASALIRPLQERFLADLPGTLSMIRDHEAQALLAKSIEHILLNNGAGRIEEAWEWANTEPASEFTSNLKRNLARHIMMAQSDNAIDWARELIANGGADSISFNGLAQIAIKDPNDLQKFDDVFQHAPAEVRQDAIMWSLSRGDALDFDHETWLGWANQLPHEKRDRTVMRRAGRLVATDPDTAIEWADNLPEADRANAYEGLATIWSRSDSYETSQWIATLPTGAERDAATLALVQAVAASEPDSAWEWAQTIQAPGKRMEAFQQALQQFSSSARHVLENTHLPPEEAAQLQTWLDNQNASANQ